MLTLANLLAGTGYASNLRSRSLLPYSLRGAAVEQKGNALSGVPAEATGAAGR